MRDYLRTTIAGSRTFLCVPAAGQTELAHRQGFSGGGENLDDSGCELALHAIEMQAFGRRAWGRDAENALRVNVPRLRQQLWRHRNWPFQPGKLGPGPAADHDAKHFGTVHPWLSARA
jgi:hypothetical protein